ncbi:MAG: hypothetical protein Q9227_009138 [Pyrenula ochraceoflavens]
MSASQSKSSNVSCGHKSPLPKTDLLAGEFSCKICSHRSTFEAANAIRLDSEDKRAALTKSAQECITRLDVRKKELSDIGATLKDLRADPPSKVRVLLHRKWESNVSNAKGKERDLEKEIHSLEKERDEIKTKLGNELDDMLSKIKSLWDKWEEKWGEMV